MKLIKIILTIFILGNPIMIHSEHFRIFTSGGKEISFDDLLTKTLQHDVVLLGETHDDPTAHTIEEKLLRAMTEKQKLKNQKLCLSLEMFERDTQLYLDEYLMNLIREKDFLSTSRPWSNYKDYRPLIEFAKENKLSVIAANAPAPYVNRASRLGPDSLRELSEKSRQNLPPLPIKPPSPNYAKKFEDQMKGMPDHAKSFNILDGQNLRDASMSYFISLHLLRDPQTKILHIAGRFHTEMKQGMYDHLMYYRPGTKVFVLTIVSGEGFPNFNKEKHGALGDIIILTDPDLPRSFKPDFHKKMEPKNKEPSKVEL